MARSRNSRRFRAGFWLAECAALMLMLGAPAMAATQGTEPGTKPPPQQQQPVPLPPAPPEKVDPPLAEKSTPGVLKPPDVGDDEAVKRPPDEAETRMPVIPPPGSTGGDPMVRPK